MAQAGDAMARRYLAVGLALFGALAWLVQLAWAFRGASLAVVNGRLLFDLSGTVLAAAIPVVGALLLARGREAGVAILATAGVITLPALVMLPRFLGSLVGEGMELALTLVNVSGMVAVVGAGVLAWTLRRPERWRWERPVASPYVAVAAVALLLDQLPAIFRASGVLGLVPVDLLSLSSLARFLVTALVLVAAARLPRPLAAWLLLVVFTSRVHVSLSGLLWFRIPQTGLDAALFWLGAGAQVTLLALAVWWLATVRERDLEPSARTPDRSLPSPE